MNPRDARDRLIVALDYPDITSALALEVALGDSIQWYKVGLELYLGGGMKAVSTLVERGRSVFLDLKLHDIPNTVAGAVRNVARSGASLLTVHAGGGPAMLAAAAEAAAAVPGAPRILAVTVLTSMDRQQLSAAGIERSAAEQVELLGAMAISAGADGLVCSAEESSNLRAKLGAGPLLVVPGIRPAGSPLGDRRTGVAPDDQKRIASPASALENGASYLVVGRPITQAADPRQAALRILSEMQTAHAL